MMKYQMITTDAIIKKVFNPMRNYFVKNGLVRNSL